MLISLALRSLKTLASLLGGNDDRGPGVLLGIRLGNSCDVRFEEESFAFGGGSWGSELSEPGCETQSSDRESSHAWSILCRIVRS